MRSGHFWIKTPDKYADKKKTQVLVPGENRSLSLEPGDGLLYKGYDVHTGVKQCLDLRRRVRNCLVKHSNRNSTIIKSSSIMFLLMETEHTALGIRAR